jgi:hypothetical protein
MGAVEILHIGQRHLQSAPTTLPRNELGVAHPARIDILAQGVEQLFVAYNFAKFHRNLLFSA